MYSPSRRSVSLDGDVQSVAMRRFRHLPLVLALAIMIPTAAYAFTGAPAGDVRAKVTFIGDSNITRGASQLVGVMSPSQVGYVGTFASRDGAGLYWNGCHPGAACPDVNATDYWAQRLLDLPPADVYVIDLGIVDAKTQGTATTHGYAWWGTKIDWLMGKLGGKPVLWSNLACTHVPEERKTGCATINQSLWNARARWSNLTFVQWRSVAEANYPAWFAPDGFHFTPAGYLGYANLIKATLDTVT